MPREGVCAQPTLKLRLGHMVPNTLIVSQGIESNTTKKVQMQKSHKALQSTRQLMAEGPLVVRGERCRSHLIVLRASGRQLVVVAEMGPTIILQGL